MAVGKFWRKSEDPPSDEKDLPADRARRQSHDLESSQDRKMSRLGEPVAGVSGSDDDLATSIGKQMELEANNSIKYRTCSWQKTAALLFSEYICLAIMSFPYSYSLLGLARGIILTIVVAALVLYTSLIVWEFCMKHPEVRDVCDLGQMLFWGWEWTWYLTAVMFLLNNTFIQGLHVLVGAEYLNTMSGHSLCTVAFSAIMAIIAWACSLPRTFDTLAKLATVSAFFTFISVILAAIFAGIEGRPAKYNPDPKYVSATGTGGGEPLVLAVPAAGTTFVAGLNAFLNISYTFIGQITLPSFIAEMKQPRDFPKALWAVTIAEIIVFSLVGAIVYAYTGNQYMSSPAFGSLSNEIYLKVSFSFMIPTLIFLGVLYASVSARFICQFPLRPWLRCREIGYPATFAKWHKLVIRHPRTASADSSLIVFRIFEGSRHKGNHTVLGWSVWAAILAVTWVVAFVIAEVIPFFSDLLSLMSSLFDSFFGFIFWGVAYMRLRKAQYGDGWITGRGLRSILGFILNTVIILIGLFFLTAGTYASVESIVLGYQSSIFKGGSFTCDNNGL